MVIAIKTKQISKHVILHALSKENTNITNFTIIIMMIIIIIIQ